MEKLYSKKEIASQQLQTSVWLFLNAVDYSSAITLAGASDNILHQLLLNESKTPFLEYAREVHNNLIGFTPKRDSYKHQIEKVMGIISLKHMSSDCHDEVEIDLQDCAKNAVTKAILNYIKLCGKEDRFVIAFLNWLWINEDGSAMMEEYELLPTSLKPNGF